MSTLPQLRIPTPPSLLYVVNPHNNQQSTLHVDKTYRQAEAAHLLQQYREQIHIIALAFGAERHVHLANNAA